MYMNLIKFKRQDTFVTRFIININHILVKLTSHKIVILLLYFNF